MPARPTRSVACHRCHGRRVKCSGGQPCSNCRRARTAECVYPKKDRLVKVSQEYINELAAENQRLQRLVSQPEPHHPDHQQRDDREDSSPQSPQLASAPWFININIAVPHTPILIAEASDSAFATRFRQAMSSPEHSHLPRVSYASENLLSALSDAACAWPSPPLARLLIKAALACLGSWCHVVRGSVVLEEFEQSLGQAQSMGALRQNKFWALFAIGKMYTARTSSETFPGLEYFAKASRVLSIMSERPIIEMVETWLLLSYYSLCLNRRHCAYGLAGSAVRTAVIMGMHLNVPDLELLDDGAREHRIRVWWTAYMFDRMWAIKMGYPAAVNDIDIEVDLPSNKYVDCGGDFADPTLFVAMIQLARVSGGVIHSIYHKNARQTTLSRRVHDSLSALTQWRTDLPPSLRLDPATEGTRDHRAESMHLLFNQLVVTATRPILLHIFRTRLKAKETGTPASIPDFASALSNACIQCARHSCQILTDAWLRGTFMTFDYFYTQYLFSAATVLAISSLLDDQDSQADRDSFDTAVQFITQLRDSGNFAAAEFGQHVDAMTSLFASVEAKTQPHGSDLAAARMQSFAADSVLADSLSSSLLAEPALDLDFINASLETDSTLGLYWPSFS